MSNKQLILWFSGFILLAMCCMGTVVAGWQIFYLLQDMPLAYLLNQLNPTPTPTIYLDRTPVVSPTLTTAPLVATPEAQANTPSPTSQPQSDTEAAFGQANPPARDQRLLAMRLRNHGETIPEVVRQTALPYQLGDTATFWVTDNQTPPRQFEAKATIRYLTDHSCWWVQEGMSVDQADLKKSAERFEQKTYPNNRAFFGSEWTPGIDGDVRLHIFMGDVPSVAGYFSASNSYSKLAESYSNEHEMFFINLRAIHPGNDNFDGVLAHEFQHMIHWHQDRNEDTWVNEGLSELASFINNYGTSDFMGSFLSQPNTQLNTWATDSDASGYNYGSSFLFMAYFLDQYGEDATQAMVAHSENGIVGFNAVLKERHNKENFDDIFANFVVANYLNNPKIGTGAWGYKTMSPPSVAVEKNFKSYPIKEQSTVYQYAAKYYELNSQHPLTIEFTGSTRVSVVDNKPHSGKYEWYSNRGDEIDTTLTRAFDLSAVKQATLSYWVWYDIEPDWDYGYVEISVDGGKTWQILKTAHTSTTNPSGNGYGAGYTGKSDGWIEETINLATYAGQKILLRFEYVTDDAVNHPGLMLDDVRIPEINFFDDAENGLNDWQADGFVRIDNILPQKFLVQLLEIGAGDNITVQNLPLDETNYGQLPVNGLGKTVTKAVLVISGLTPVTTQPAHYQVNITH